MTSDPDFVERVPEPLLIVVSGPSGAGKDTVVQRMQERGLPFHFVVTATTRPRRPGETHGKDYWFVSTDEFDAMVRNGEFAEWAFVHRNRYGTAIAPIEAALAQGRDVIFDVDWQGGAALSLRWPEDCLKIFVLPPDLETLERRLRQRATDAPHVVETRLRNAKDELTHYPEYEHLVVNDDLERAYGLLRGIYLTRKYGEVSQTDVPYDLAAEAERVKQDRNAAWAHAKTLVGR